MADALKQALRSLCTKTGWCYAVFWKLKRRSRMVLTWEDGHYDALQTGNGRSPLEHGLFRQMEDQINLAVAKMSFHVYSLGEGIIGRVAFTGKHQWIYGCRVSSEKYPDGWSNQFAAGINTIAVVAVPQGVVQLGSIQVMAEDLNLVGHIRGLFGTLQSVPGAFVSELTTDAQGARSLSVARAPTVVTSTNVTGSWLLLGKDYAPPFSQFGSGSAAGFINPASGVDQLKLAQSAASYNQSQPIAYTSLDQKLPIPMEQQQSVFQLQNTLLRGCLDDRSDFVKRPKLTETGYPSQRSSSGSFGALLGSTTELPPVDNRQQLGPSFSTGDGFDSLQLDLDDDGFDYNSLFKAFQKDDMDDFNGVLAALDRDLASSQPASTGFAVGDELSEALAPQAAHRNSTASTEVTSITATTTAAATNSNMLLVSQPVEDAKAIDRHLQAFELPSAETTTTTMTTLPGGYCDILVGLSDKKPEPLLDAVVAGAGSASPTPKAVSKDSPKLAQPPQPAPPPPPLQNLCFGQPAAAAAAKELDQALSKLSSQQHCKLTKWPPVGLQVKVPWPDKKSDDHPFKDCTSKKQDEARVAGRKRLRAGETPRPRPKDRQQIQDRVRELRDIVPNATKCSIDSLLEKTIKHMQFLQSVTQHGDKWKAGADAKAGSVFEKQCAENGSGAAWALELDKNACPVAVENRQPGQMLVEMLCEEKGLFWEIADNIRSLGLTILKGVMESRNDKVWARFNVEASRDVDRVKVLWNLLQLLKSNAEKHNHGGAPVAAVTTTTTTTTTAGAATPTIGTGAGTGTATATATTGSFAGSEVTEVCSESGFQPASHRGIAVSSTGW